MISKINHAMETPDDWWLMGRFKTPRVELQVFFAVLLALSIFCNLQ